MKKYVGIDVGSKFIGLAIADGEVRIATPYKVIPVTASSFSQVMDVILREEVAEVVLGKSVDSKGVDNAIALEIEKLRIEMKSKIPEVAIHFQDERYTSVEARRSPFFKKGERADASAAALILQAWLDKNY